MHVVGHDDKTKQQKSAGSAFCGNVLHDNGPLARRKRIQSASDTRGNEKYPVMVGNASQASHGALIVIQRRVINVAQRLLQHERLKRDL